MNYLLEDNDEWVFRCPKSKKLGPESQNQFSSTSVSSTLASASASVRSSEPLPTATTDDELNQLLEQIEEEISKDMDLTQDLLDILDDETREQDEEEPCYEEPMEEEVGLSRSYRLAS